MIRFHKQIHGIFYFGYVQDYFGDFENFQSALCGDFEKYQRAPVCGLCTVGCEDFEKFSKIKTPCAVDFPSVLERLIILEKIPVLGIFPCTGEIGFFRVKIPVLEKFFALCSKKKKTLAHQCRQIENSLLTLFQDHE